MKPYVTYAAFCFLLARSFPACQFNKTVGLASTNFRLAVADQDAIRLIFQMYALIVKPTYRQTERRNFTKTFAAPRSIYLCRFDVNLRALALDASRCAALNAETAAHQLLSCSVFPGSGASSNTMRYFQTNWLASIISSPLLAEREDVCVKLLKPS